MYLQLAWRNIWRNPRRTAVILTSIIVGVTSMLFSSALMRGIAEQMVRNGVATLTGHIQIHRAGYRNDPSAGNSMTDLDRVRGVLKDGLPAGSRSVERIRVNAVISNARHSAGTTLVGIDPGQERGVSFIPSAVVSGRYLDADDAYGLLAGQALIDEFETRLGNKLVLTAQDAHGEIASRAHRIVGIYRAELEATENRFVFITLPAAREVLRLPEGASEVSIVLLRQKDVASTAAALRGAFAASDFEVMQWQELLPFVAGVVKMYNGLILVSYLLTFVAMGFGIVNTILMAVLERTQEFGLLRAIGMTPRSIVREVMAESSLLLFIGMVAGNCVGFATTSALSVRGFDLTALASGMERAGLPRVVFPDLMLKDAVLANLVVFFLGMLISAYPAVKAGRFTPCQAMKQT